LLALGDVPTRLWLARGMGRTLLHCGRLVTSVPNAVATLRSMRALVQSDRLRWRPARDKFALCVYGGSAPLVGTRRHSGGVERVAQPRGLRRDVHLGVRGDRLPWSGLDQPDV
jgi:hypothetical protein